MSNSFIDPSLVEMALPRGPGWEWNPGQTFVTAFNNAQENKRLNERAAMEQELNAILLPAKKAQAEFTIKQLAYESGLLESSYKSGSAELEERYRLIKSGGANNSVSAENAAGPQSSFKTGSNVRNLLQSYMGGGNASSGSGKILGSGLTGE